MGRIQEKTCTDLCLRKSWTFPEDCSSLKTAEVKITFKMSTLQVATQEKKKKAAARKKDILHRMIKSISKTHLPNFENRKWGFHVKSRIEKLLYPATLHGMSFELASGCLVSKGLVTFPALYPALYRSQDHSNSPAGCHQHVQYVKQHKAEGQKST